MGQAKQRGTKKERMEQALKEKLAIESEYTPEEIAIATKTASLAGCSVEKALKSLRIIRKQNDEAAAKLGYKRVGNSAEGIALFAKENE